MFGNSRFMSVYDIQYNLLQQTVVCPHGFFRRRIRRGNADSSGIPIFPFKQSVNMRPIIGRVIFFLQKIYLKNFIGNESQKAAQI